MLGASNLRQQRRLWTVLERPDMIKRSNDERDSDHAREIAVLEEIMRTRTADEWEEFLQARHVPAARVRTMGEAIADPQIATRGVIHRHDSTAGMEGGYGVPLAAFTFAHGGPRIDAPPPTLGQHKRKSSTSSPAPGDRRLCRAALARSTSRRVGQYWRRLGALPPPVKGEGLGRGKEEHQSRLPPPSPLPVSGEGDAVARLRRRDRIRFKSPDVSQDQETVCSSSRRGRARHATAIATLITHGGQSRCAGSSLWRRSPSWSRSPLLGERHIRPHEDRHHGGGTERPATISPYEIMVTQGKDLPVEKHTADPF